MTAQRANLPVKAIFKALDPEGAEVVRFVVEVDESGQLQVSGDAGMAARLGIPNQPARVIGKPDTSPSDSGAYIAALLEAYRGSRFWAEPG